MSYNPFISALKEDAEAAVSALQGSDLKGRSMKLELARSGHSKEEAPQIEQAKPEAKATEIQVAAKAMDENNASDIRPALQVALVGVPSGLNKKVLTREVIKKINRKSSVAVIDAAHCLYESLGSDTIISPPGKSMLITCPSRKHVDLFVSKLGGVSIGSLGVASAADGASHLAAAKLFARRLADVTDVRLRKKKCRLILRNLSFQASVANVLDRMSRFGPLVEASLPTVTVQHKDGSTKEKSRGFAFVTYLCAADADRAVKESAGLRICNREFAVDYCDSKHGHEKQMQAEKEASTKADDTSTDRKTPDDSEDGYDSEQKDEGISDEENGSEEDEEASGSEQDVEEVSEEENGLEQGDDVSDEENGSEQEEGVSEEENGSELEDEEDEADTRPTALSGDVSEQRTVFVRDLAFDATTADLRKTFTRFGVVDMVAIVKGMRPC